MFSLSRDNLETVVTLIVGPQNGVSRPCASWSAWSARCLFTLDWIDDPELRRTTGQELKG